MSEEFKPGDIVEFKLGGPAMVVSSVNEPGDWIICRWWVQPLSDPGYFQTGEFASSTELEPAEDEKPEVAIAPVVVALEKIGPNALPGALAALPDILAKALRDHFDSKEVG